MNKCRAALILVATLGTFALSAQAHAAASEAINIAGTWEMSWTQFGATNVDRIELQASGDRISGKGFRGRAIEGTRARNKLELRMLNTDKRTNATVTASIRNDGLSRTLKIDADEYDWAARRPADAPRRHDFQPTRFHRYFSGSIPPALKIWPGDTVHTETVDAGGVDKNGSRRSRGGNPLTGPFYVEGALGGDTLVVHFNRIRLNRDTARSGGA